MKQHVIETVVGFAVIIIALVFFSFAYKMGNSSKIDKGYTVTASFQNAEGIINGSDVMLAGVKIGSVTNIILDKTSFFALLTININNEIKLPKDTSLAIVTSGLLGGKYIAVTPGSSEETLAANDQVKYTQSSVSIEAIIGKLIYSFGGSNK
ncbi:outer membrane lipid asymmetry maintenance protein MlaD [Candidatus Tisiphia endosymbiont of Nemotelus uliginosus]|uniref:outer membrane lipid asymmetry maintenance protein MlaD n=1 Tax=Candidatus Tisiphia endosymbiont of Nemotelus uliginosus TaxID=3077926 RepID=UPI0035C8C6D4